MDDGKAFRPPFADAMDRAYEALMAKWQEQAEPPERFRITFASGWGGCGDVMAAIGGFENSLEDVCWSHDPPMHSCSFSCPFPILKTVQAAVKGSPVRDLRCTRI